MRPLPGSSAFPGNASPGDRAADRFTSQTTTPQMTYILADEAAVEATLSPPFPPSHRARDQRKHPIYNLLGDGPAPSRDSCAAPPLPTSRSASTFQARESASHRSPSTNNRSPTGSQTPPPASISQPMTPILYGVSGPCSAISSSSSRRNSLAGSLSEYQESFVMSAFAASDPGQPQSTYNGEGVQQFIMPTINVPSRRPFTEVGKCLGRLKLLVAGKSGLGKTSLIRAITHSCPHIVHVDPTVPVAMASTGLLPANRPGSDPPIDQGTFQITETCASTKPYPPWWKESVQTGSASALGSTQDTVLDRNVCLVDTPGYQESCRPTDTASQVSQYVELHLHKNRLDGLDNADVLKTITEGGGLLVDAVLYFISSSGLSSTDTQYLRQLEPLTNVIPVLAHADTLTLEQAEASKELIARQLREAGIQLFTFSSLPSNATESSIYAISSKLGSDHDVMEASLLMSSEYIQPLVPTDLSLLLDHIFSSDGAAWLRHAAAQKLLEWRSRHPASNNSVSTFAKHSNSSMERRLLRTGTVMSRVPSYALYEEQFCRVQLSNWAADLQRSLANERALHERRSREQAAAWLRETLRDDGLPRDGTRTAMALTRARGRGSRQHSFGRRRHRTVSDQTWASVRHQDPLGLLQLKPDLRWQGWNTLEMVGGIGILGGLAWLFV